MRPLGLILHHLRFPGPARNPCRPAHDVSSVKSRLVSPTVSSLCLRDAMLMKPQAVQTF
jgi:hypothetical protein